jgi:hypothetical protein
MLNMPLQIWSILKTTWMIVALTLDSHNIRAVRPFPAAALRWEIGLAFSMSGIKLVPAQRENKSDDEFSFFLTYV